MRAHLLDREVLEVVNGQWDELIFPCSLGKSIKRLQLCQIIPPCITFPLGHWLGMFVLPACACLLKVVTNAFGFIIKNISITVNISRNVEIRQR